MDQIEFALATLELEEKPNYTNIAKEYGVSRRTLSTSHRRISTSRSQADSNRGKLNAGQQTRLNTYINDLCRRRFSPTTVMVQNFARDIAKQAVGKNWVSGFVQRHQCGGSVHDLSTVGDCDASRRYGRQT